tara:strand:+ start:129 stop:521 length:393 start_codon:yes stop_codon:yes gene_type:complete
MTEIAESNIMHRDSKGVIRKWIDQKTGDVMEHECDINDKWCQEGANPNRHPDHDSHITGCTCELRGHEECEEFVSLCCGAGKHEYVESICNQCLDHTGFECVDCGVMEDEVGERFKVISDIGIALAIANL